MHPKKRKYIRKPSGHLVKVREAAKKIKAKRLNPPEKQRAIFWPDHVDEVKAIAMSGATDDEMAALMNISPELLASWKGYYPLFADAIEDGRTHADAAVVAALHSNAVGFEYETDEVIRTRRGADVITVRKRALPDTQAQKFWLQNRRPEQWNRVNTHTVGGTKGGDPIRLDVKAETKTEVIHSILNMIAPQPDSSE